MLLSLLFTTTGQSTTCVWRKERGLVLHAYRVKARCISFSSCISHILYISCQLILLPPAQCMSASLSCNMLHTYVRKLQGRVTLQGGQGKPAPPPPHVLLICFGADPRVVCC